MSTDALIVFLTPSWFGGAMWQALAAEIEAQGWRTFAPTLLGLGERHNEGDADTGLRAQVDDLVAVLARRPERALILVGHSYGGSIASELAARLPDRVTKIIFLDAFVSTAGQSIYERYPFTRDLMAPLIDPARPGFIQPPPMEALGLPDDAATAALRQHMSPQAVRTYSEPATVSTDALACEKVYVQFDATPMFADTLAEAKAKGWTVRTLEAGHMGPLTHTHAVATEILDILA